MERCHGSEQGKMLWKWSGKDVLDWIRERCRENYQKRMSQKWSGKDLTELIRNSSRGFDQGKMSLRQYWVASSHRAGWSTLEILIRSVHSRTGFTRLKSSRRGGCNSCNSAGRRGLSSSDVTDWNLKGHNSRFEFFSKKNWADAIFGQQRCTLWLDTVSCAGHLGVKILKNKFWFSIFSPCQTWSFTMRFHSTFARKQ